MTCTNSAHVRYSLPSLVAQAEANAVPRTRATPRSARDSSEIRSAISGTADGPRSTFSGTAGERSMWSGSAIDPAAAFGPRNHLLAIPMLFPLWSSPLAKERTNSGNGPPERTASRRKDSIFDLTPSPRSRSKASFPIIAPPNSLVRYFVFPGMMPWFLMELVTVQLYIGTVLSTAAQAAIGPMQFEMFSGGNVLNVTGQHNSRSEMRVIGGPTTEAAIVWIITGPSVLGHTRFLTDSFNHLMQGEFAQVKYDIHCPCACTSCSGKTAQLHMGKGDTGLMNDNVFSLADLEEKYATGTTTVACPSNEMPVLIEKMAPEVALADMRAIQVEYDAVKLEKLVAQGGFGKVFRANLGGDTVAVKEIFCDSEADVGPSFREFRRECWIMAIVSQCPYVVSLKGFSIKKCNSTLLGVYEDPASFTLIMDFISVGNLHSYLHKPDAKLSWHLRRKIARDIAAGMVFLHQCQVLHHDLKSLNVFLASTEVGDEVVAKVGDFGEARISFSYSKRDNVSNPTWLAPEVLMNEPYSKKSDVYSFGITMFELASRELPFMEYPVANSPFVFELESAIKEGLRPNMTRLLSDVPAFDWASEENKCPKAWHTLYARCVDENPLSRPDFAEILQILEAMRM